MPLHVDPLPVLRNGAVPLDDGPDRHDALIEHIGEARFVLLGEASHGTHEFYAERAAITRRLVEERGFAAVAAEADWPDATRVARWLLGRGDDTTVEEALGGFTRFPRWMWRNTVVRNLLDWAKAANDAGGGWRDAGRLPVTFHGLDLYSLSASMAAVVEYLDKVDPAAAARARDRFACFEGGGDDGAGYARRAAFGAGDTCEQEVIDQLVELCGRALRYTGDGDGDGDDAGRAEDEFFVAEQNARVIRDAEEYYRSMFGGRVRSWNLRDEHMAGTLDDLADHLSRRRGERAKLVVWAHNSHLGDARATEMTTWGERNLGQLVRERHPGDVVNVGFTTYDGTVTAADDWDRPARRHDVRPAPRGSHEALLHDVGLPAFALFPMDGGPVADVLRQPRLERAIGVVYRPQTERESHYFEARMADQFDVVLHLDRTSALAPLDADPGHEEGVDVPDTWPSAV